MEKHKGDKSSTSIPSAAPRFSLVEGPVAYCTRRRTSLAVVGKTGKQIDPFLCGDRIHISSIARIQSGEYINSPLDADSPTTDRFMRCSRRRDQPLFSAESYRGSIRSGADSLFGAQEEYGFPVHPNLRFESPMFGRSGWRLDPSLRFTICCEGRRMDVIHPTYYADLRTYRGWHSPLVIPFTTCVRTLSRDIPRRSFTVIQEGVHRAGRHRDMHLRKHESDRAASTRRREENQRYPPGIRFSKENVGGAGERSRTEAIPYFLYVGARAARIRTSAFFWRPFRYSTLDFPTVPPGRCWPPLHCRG